MILRACELRNGTIVKTIECWAMSKLGLTGASADLSGSWEKIVAWAVLVNLHACFVCYVLMSTLRVVCPVVAVGPSLFSARFGWVDMCFVQYVSMSILRPSEPPKIDSPSLFFPKSLRLRRASAMWVGNSNRSVPSRSKGLWIVIWRNNVNKRRRPAFPQGKDSWHEGH